MFRSGMTVSDAAHEWVREFNRIPTSMIEKLMAQDPDDWSEVTTPCPGDRVFVYDCPGCNGICGGEIRSYNEEAGLYAVQLDSGPLLSCAPEDFEVERDGAIPMWGSMWSFGDLLDDEWLEDGGIGIMSRCGFRVYLSEEFGYFFGIDGAGYDFYEAHWCPLYLARGLQWHDPAA